MEMLGKIRRMYWRDRLSLHEITRRTGLSRNTIKKWIKAGAVSNRPKYRRRDRPGKLTLFEARLTQALTTDAHRAKCDDHDQPRVRRVGALGRRLETLLRQYARDRAASRGIDRGGRALRGRRGFRGEQFRPGSETDRLRQAIDFVLWRVGGVELL